MSERWRAHKYQKYVVKEGLLKKYLALLIDCGLGKTTIILEIFRRLKKMNKVKGVLVVAPLRPCFMVWPQEIKKWHNFKQISFTVLHPQWGDREINFNRPKDFYITNPESLAWVISKLKGKRKKNWPFDMLVVDESTKFKDTGTNRFKFMKKLVPHFNRRYTLTGTPAPNSMQDLQGQLYIVDQGESFGIKKSYFLPEYFRQVGNPKWQQWELKKSKEKSLYRKFAKFAIRLRAEDHLELPPRIDNIIKIALPKKARKQYNRMEKEFFIKLDNGEEITSMSGSATYQKLWQMSNGAVYKQDPEIIQPNVKRKSNDYHLIHNAKIEALENLIDEMNGKPLLLGYFFQHDYLRLKKHFGKRMHNIGSKASMLDCVKIQKKFNAGKIQILSAHPKSAALGLNLQGSGGDVCFFSLLQDLEAYFQFIMRILRQGFIGETVTVHHLLAEKTIDEVLLESLQKKEENQTKFLEFVRKYKRKRMKELENMV